MTTLTAPAKTKDMLRQEARRLFARHGYEGVSMRDIAQAVGIRQSAIYNHFPSKQDLLVDLMAAHMERVLAALRAALDVGGGPAARLEAFARFHVTYHMSQTQDVFLAYMELRSLEEPGRARVRKLRSDYEAELIGILTDGVGQGFKIGDAAVVARAILAMLTGVTVWFRDGAGLTRDAVAEIYVQSVMQSVGLSYTKGG